MFIRVFLATKVLTARLRPTYAAYSVNGGYTNDTIDSIRVAPRSQTRVSRDSSQYTFVTVHTSAAGSAARTARPSTVHAIQRNSTNTYNLGRVTFQHQPKAPVFTFDHHGRTFSGSVCSSCTVGCHCEWQPSAVRRWAQGAKSGLAPVRLFDVFQGDALVSPLRFVGGRAHLPEGPQAHLLNLVLLALFD